MKNLIYLDNNATTQIAPEILEAMMPFLTDNYANASSTHVFGLKAHDAVKKARNQVADLIGAETNEIVFTSGATEAINLAIKGVAESYSSKGKHIITVQTEHKAVLDTCEYLETKGFEVSYLPVERDGLINMEVYKATIREDTILVSVMIANNETGVIQDIAEIAKIAHQFGALFMTDATQAIGKTHVKVNELGIDLLCFSGHKIYGPKGVGALYIKQGKNRVKLDAILHGGGHEKGMRSGTLNVPGIVGLGVACSIAEIEMSKNAQTIGPMRDYLESELLKIDGTSVNGNITNRLFNTSNILFRGVDSDAVIMGCSNIDDELPLIAVSNGSACTSASIEASHVLTAMGLVEIEAFSSIRFSIGKFNSMKEIEIVIENLNKIVNSLRAMVI